MAEKTFSFEIVTPQRVVFSGPVESFSAPGVVGGFQVLYNHAPLLAAIGIGEVRVRDGAGKEHRYATSGGFVDVVKNRAVLLAETAENARDIDVERARAARERAQQRLAGKDTDLDSDRARAALLRAINRLRIAQPG